MVILLDWDRKHNLEQDRRNSKFLDSGTITIADFNYVIPERWTAPQFAPDCTHVTTQMRQAVADKMGGFMGNARRVKRPLKVCVSSNCLYSPLRFVIKSCILNK